MADGCGRRIASGFWDAFGPGNGGDPMPLFYKQNAAARFFVGQTNGKVYEVVGGSAALLCWRNGVK